MNRHPATPEPARPAPHPAANPYAYQGAVPGPPASPPSGPVGYLPFPGSTPAAAAAPGGLRPAAVTAIAAACGLVGVLLGVTGTLAATTDTLTGSAATARPAEQVLPERLPELVAFIEQETGVHFIDQPEVELLDDGEFVAALMTPSGSGPVEADVADFDRTSLALGLVDDLDGAAQDAQTAYSDGVAGFYDAPTDRLVVRGERWSPGVEATVVHELVHALQDQHVDLEVRTARTRADDDSYLAFTAVVEGHASVVEQAWVSAQGPDYEADYWDEMMDAGPGPASEPLVDVLAVLPYDLGWQAVSATVAEQGPGGAWTLLRDPPTTLEQVWDLTGRTEAAHRSHPGVVVAEPEAPVDGHVVDRGTLGAHLLTLLATADRDEWFVLDGLLPGWAGDRYVTWTTTSEQVCTRLDLLVDDDAVGGVREGLTTWGRSGGTLTAGPGGTLRLERCSQE